MRRERGRKATSELERQISETDILIGTANYNFNKKNIGRNVLLTRPQTKSITCDIC